MNTSRPRTFSMISTLTSPSLKRPTVSAADRQLQVARDVVRQRGIGVPGEQRQRFRYPRCSVSLIMLNQWLGWKDSNLRMAGSKPAALPLGDTPASRSLTPASASPSMRVQRRVIQSARDETAPAIRNPRRDTLRVLLRARSWRRYTRPCRSVARRDRRAVRIDLRSAANRAPAATSACAHARPVRNRCRCRLPKRRVL